MFRLKISKTFVVFLFFLLCIPNVYAIVDATDDFYVNDYANVLSYETEKYILDKSIQLYQNNGAQIVVVTVNDMDGLPIEDYALELFRKFGIGDEDKDNGLLILVSVSERELRVEVGYGLEGILPDSKVGRLEDNYMIPYLKGNDWDNGIKNGYDAFYDVILFGSDVDTGVQVEEDGLLYYEIMIIINLVVGLGFGLVYKIKGLSKKNNNKIKKVRHRFFCVYVAVLVLSLFVEYFIVMDTDSTILFLFANTFAFVTAAFSNGISISGGSGRYSGGSYRSSSRGFSSRHSGGGGSSGGGGASRKF